jgi:hypothetical protein
MGSVRGSRIRGGRVNRAEYEGKVREKDHEVPLGVAGFPRREWWVFSSQQR